MKKSKKIVISVISTVAVGIFAIGVYRFIKSPAYLKESVPKAVSIQSFNKMPEPIQAPETTKPVINTPVLRDVPKAKPKVVPKELNLAMTFYSQAPFVDWSEPWQNACEEASILLVANTYFNHNWTKEEFRDEILALVKWENKTFGDYKSTNAQQITKMLDEVYNLKSIIHTSPTFADVQKIIDNGHLIIMTFDGRKLGNPFFTNGGPDYHSLVIKGYKEGEKVITEDVGTQHGENYVYAWKTIENANHDYATPISNGAKMMIEVLPPSQK
ncbi:MAG: C39 family peptidase [Candidatus Peregrinibacteria bacterium]|nr:C39 family peptidase [Candidatus Peregrinibacteria bacterium]